MELFQLHCYTKCSYKVWISDLCSSWYALDLRVGKKSKYEHLHLQSGLKLEPTRDCKQKISSRPDTDRYVHTTENWSTEQVQLGESKGLHVKCCPDSVPIHWNKKWTGEFQESDALFLSQTTSCPLSRHPSLHTHFSILVSSCFQNSSHLSDHFHFIRTPSLCWEQTVVF